MLTSTSHSSIISAKRCFIMHKLLLLTVLFMSTAALAAEPSSSDFAKLFDQYNAAVKTGNLSQIMALRTAKSKKQILEQTKTPN